MNSQLDASGNCARYSSAEEFLIAKTTTVRNDNNKNSVLSVPPW